ncbi:MAG: homoserine dehydrogenase [Pseudomonadota bacterium]|nr:homoserine dehydrogenase [Pseudomonadota bacterium]
MSENNINVGIIGLGTVGSGVVNLIKKNHDEIYKRAGLNIQIKAVSARNKDLKRECDISQFTFYDNPLDLIENEKIDIVIELIGGDTISKEIVTKAIQKKIHVITANKALISIHGNDLSDLSYKNDVVISYEAAVAGSIPIIKIIRESLNANKINWVSGIINGTTNYILTTMIEKGKDLGSILEEAQKLGYAESDPSFDIGGIDAAHKLSILASISFGIPLNFNSIYIEGIENITLEDLKYSSELGYNIKHLAIAKKVSDGIQLRVHPALVPKSRLIANVNGVMNAIVVSSDAAGASLYYGQGAGGSATASAVVSDIIDVSRKVILEKKIDIPFLGYQKKLQNNEKILNINDVEVSYYLRLRVINKSGVLAKITKILGSKNISIDSILQKEKIYEDNTVPIVMLTHNIKEEGIIKAINELEKLEEVKDNIIKIRIETFN